MGEAHIIDALFFTVKWYDFTVVLHTDVPYFFPSAFALFLALKMNN